MNEPLDERIRAALMAEANTVTTLPPRRRVVDPAPVPLGARRRWLAPVLAAAVVIAVVAGIAIGITRSNKAGRTPAGVTSSSTAAPRPTESTTPSQSNTQSSGPTESTAPTGATESGPITYSPGVFALWPFTSASEDLAWQHAYALSNEDAWHVDPDATAVRFATDYLGFTDMSEVTSRTGDGTTRLQIGIGFGAPGTATAAVVDLARTSTTAAWEVTGATSSSLSISTPKVGATISSAAGARVVVSGLITGVDESIHVTVRQGDPIADGCCQPAGGTNTPWSATVALHGQQTGIAVIVASTGGHLEAVERFAVRGVLVT